MTRGVFGTAAAALAAACVVACAAASPSLLRGGGGAAASSPFIAASPSAAAMPTALLATGLGGLWRSTDAFATRTKVIDDLVDKVEFVGARTVIATGREIWASRDGGETFTVAYARKGATTDNTGITRFSFAEGGQVGMAVGMEMDGDSPVGMAFVTTDGGATWTPRPAGNDSYPVGVAALGGVPAPANPQFAAFMLHMPAEGNVWVSVDVTSDLGASWQQQSKIDTTNLTLQNGYDADIFATDAKGEALIVTGWSLDGALNSSRGAHNSGILLRSGDSGGSWTRDVPAINAPVTGNSTFGTTFYELTCAGKTTGAPVTAAACDSSPMWAAAGSFFDDDRVGYVAMSKDRGASWATVHNFDDANLRDIAASPSAPGAVCAVGQLAASGPSEPQAAVVSCSRDAGATWAAAAALPYPPLETRMWESLSLAMA